MKNKEQFVQASSRIFPLYKEVQRSVVTYKAEPGDNFEPDLDRKFDGDINYWAHYEMVSMPSRQHKTLVFHAPAELFAFRDMLDGFGFVIDSFLDDGFTVYFWNNLQPHLISSRAVFDTFIHGIEFSTRNQILKKFAELQIGEQDLVLFDCINIEHLCDHPLVHKSISHNYFRLDGVPLAYLTWSTGFKSESPNSRLRVDVNDYYPDQFSVNLARYATLTSQAFECLMQTLEVDRKISLLLLQEAYDPTHLKLFLSKFNALNQFRIICHEPENFQPEKLTEAITSLLNPFSCKFLELSVGRPKTDKRHYTMQSEIDLLSACTRHSVALVGLSLANDYVKESNNIVISASFGGRANLDTIRTLHVRFHIAPILPVIAKTLQLRTFSLENIHDAQLLFDSSIAANLSSITELYLSNILFDIEFLSKLFKLMPSLTKLVLKSCTDNTTEAQQYRSLDLKSLKILEIDYTKLKQPTLTSLIHTIQRSIEEFRYNSYDSFKIDHDDSSQLTFPKLKELSVRGHLSDLCWKIIDGSPLLEKLELNSGYHNLGEKTTFQLKTIAWDKLTHLNATVDANEFIFLLDIIQRSKNLVDLNIYFRGTTDARDEYAEQLILPIYTQLKYIRLRTDLSHVYDPDTNTSRQELRRYNKEGFECRLLHRCPSLRVLTLNTLFSILNEQELQSLDKIDWRRIQLKNYSRWVPANVPTVNSVLKIEGNGRSPGTMLLDNIIPTVNVKEIVFSEASADDVLYVRGRRYIGVCEPEDLEQLLMKTPTVERLVLRECIIYPQKGVHNKTQQLRLDKLVLLDFSGSSVHSDLVLRLIESAPSLRYLNLMDSFTIQSEEDRFRAALKSKKLSLLNLSYCNVTQKVLSGLREDHPSAKIIEKLKVDYYGMKHRTSKSSMYVEGSGVAIKNSDGISSSKLSVYQSFYDTDERLVRSDVFLLDRSQCAEFKPITKPELNNNLAQYYLHNRKLNPRLKFGIKRYNFIPGNEVKIPSYSTNDLLIGLKVTQDCQLKHCLDTRQYSLETNAGELAFQYLIEVSENTNQKAPWKNTDIDSDVSWISQIRLLPNKTLESNEASAKLQAMSAMQQVAVLEKYFYDAKQERMPTLAKNDTDLPYYNDVIASHCGTCGDKAIAMGYILTALKQICLFQKNPLHAYISVKIDDDYWPVEVGGLPAEVELKPLPPLDAVIKADESAVMKETVRFESKMLTQLRPMPPRDIGSFEEYYQWLMQKLSRLPRDRKQCIISMSDKQTLNRFISAYSKTAASSMPLCVIRDLSQFRHKLTKLVDGHEEKVDSEVIQFLKKSGKGGILLLDLDSWSAKWNPLFEENRTLDCYPVPDEVMIISLCDASNSVSEDLVSRMGFATTFMMDSLLPNITEQHKVTDESLDPTLFDKVIDLKETKFWKDCILRDIKLGSDKKWRLIQKVLIDACDQPMRVLILNPPMHDEEYRHFFENVIATRRFFFNGEMKCLAAGTNIHWAIKPMSLALYCNKFKLLDEKTQLEWQYTLCSTNFRKMFKSYAFGSNGDVEPVSTLLEQYAGRSLPMLLTSELENQQWFELFTAADAVECELQIIVPPEVHLPTEFTLASETQMKSFQPSFFFDKNGIIYTDNVLSVANEFSSKYGSATIIYVTEAMSYADLFLQIVKTESGFKTESSVVFSALQKPQTVILVSRLSLNVQTKIATLFSSRPFLLFNQQPIFPQGNLLIITDQRDSFSFVLNRMTEQSKMPETERMKVLSDEMQLYDALQDNPYVVFLATDKSDANQFLCHRYPQYSHEKQKPLVVHFGMNRFDEWLAAKDEGDHLLVITETEDSRTLRIFTNLISKVPSILHQGKLIPITNRQKVVFHARPEQHIAVQHSLLGQFFGRVLVYDKIKIARAFEITPTTDKARLSVIYQLLSQQGFTVTPSRYPMIAQLDAILCLREKQIKYPKTYDFYPICPVLTGVSGIGKSKLALSFLRAHGFVDAASPEALTTDTKKHFYNLITADISRYPEMANVPHHLQHIKIIIRAYLNGSVVIADEFNVNKELMLFLATLLNQFDAKLKPLKRGFTLIAPQNPLNYKNRNKLPADLEDFVYPIDAPELLPNEIASILEGYGASPHQAQELTKEFLKVNTELKKQGNAFNLTVRNVFNYTRHALAENAIEYPVENPRGFWARIFRQTENQDRIEPLKAKELN